MHKRGERERKLRREREEAKEREMRLEEMSEKLE